MSGTKIPVSPLRIIPLTEKYYNGIFVRTFGNRVDFMLHFIDDKGLSCTGILSRYRHIARRIAHIDFNGEIIKHSHLVENYNRVTMLIEQEKTASAINSLP